MARASSERNEVLVQLDGVFDVRAARRVEKVIEDARAGDAVRVDLSRVREFHDFGIAVLAQAVKHGGAVRIALQGLRRHQARMLRYFGVDAERFGWRSPVENA
jgi:anti-anti-sigma regulatory factor